MLGAVLYRREAGLDRVASIVLAGGEGTRLFPLTRFRAKPAVGFGGRYRLIDIPISNSLNSRIGQIFIISQYFASDLNQHIIESFPPEFFQRGDIQLLCPEETPQRKIWFKGTADAVRQNLEHLLKSPAEYFLILSGDQLYNTHFTPMLNLAIGMDADLVIASIPVAEPEAKRMGLLKISSSKQVEDFYEKPNTPELLKKFQIPQNPDSRYLGSMGIYVFKRSCLTKLLLEEGDDFGRHLIPRQVGLGNTYAYVFDGYWEDIGTISSYYEANLALLKQQENRLNIHDEAHPIYTTPHLLPSAIVRDTKITNSLISQGTIIEAKEIARSVIGVRAQIKKGCVIRDSIITGHKYYAPPPHQSPPYPPSFTIGEECEIERTIVDEESRLGNGVKLLNKKKLQQFDGDGIYIRDGIIIVTSGTDLPDGFEI